MKIAILSAFALSTALVLAVVLGMDPGRVQRPAVAGQIDVVAIAPGSFTLRLPGEYQKSGRPVDAPLRQTHVAAGFDIMKYQVSTADYARCVEAGACAAADAAPATPVTMPATGVNYLDAVAYAAWLSGVTAENWRLPTDTEWAFAAAEKFSDEGLGVNDDGANPAARWLARYRSESAKEVPDPETKPRGTFGINSKGLADVSGNVWDWTTTCYIRTSLGGDDGIGESTENCGVRVVAGRHRGYMSHFIRDGKSGGCAAGIAPDNLGIRLVRDPPSLMSRIRGLLHRATG